MEVKIKEQDKLIDATIEVVDGVMVVSPKEVKFEPKDGDVIVCGGNVRFVAIFKRMKEDYSFYYHSLFVLGEGKIPQLDNWASFMDARPVTDEEKKLLYDKLAEEGYEWDAENKQIVEVKWKPKDKEDYYSPAWHEKEFCPQETVFYNNWKLDVDRYNRKWCFKAEAECQEFCNKLNQAINSVKS